MKTIFVLLFFTFCIAIKTKELDFSYLASIRLNHSHVCSGSVISKTKILTAASCVSEGIQPVSVNDVTVRVGSINQHAGGNLYDVVRISPHYQAKNFMYNVAILVLAKPIAISNKVKIIELASYEYKIKPGIQVVVPGWRPYQWDIHLSFLKTENSSWCESAVGFGHPSVLCMSHKLNEGICDGDFGSGVVHDGKLIAVSSFAFGACGSQYPDIFSSVPYFRRWISF